MIFWGVKDGEKALYKAVRSLLTLFGADNRRIRIVYQYRHEILIVLVVSMWKREDLAVYLEAARRMQQGQVLKYSLMVF